jgi:hypothetical protein
MMSVPLGNPPSKRRFSPTIPVGLFLLPFSEKEKPLGIFPEYPRGYFLF